MPVRKKCIISGNVSNTPAMLLESSSEPSSDDNEEQRYNQSNQQQPDSNKSLQLAPSVIE